MVSGCPHKILHHNLLLRQTAIKLKGMEEVKKIREREKINPISISLTGT